MILLDMDFGHKESLCSVIVSPASMQISSFQNKFVYNVLRDLDWPTIICLARLVLQAACFACMLLITLALQILLNNWLFTQMGRLLQVVRVFFQQQIPVSKVAPQTLFLSSTQPTTKFNVFLSHQWPLQNRVT